MFILIYFIIHNLKGAYSTQIFTVKDKPIEIDSNFLIFKIDNDVYK